MKLHFEPDLDFQLSAVEAVKAVAAIEAAASPLGSTRESLSTAGDQIAGLATRFGEVADSLGENATNLREGVGAIRPGDPAAIRRQIEELDAAFTAMQAVSGERLGGAPPRVWMDRCRAPSRCSGLGSFSDQVWGISGNRQHHLHRPDRRAAGPRAGADHRLRAADAGGGVPGDRGAAGRVG